MSENLGMTFCCWLLFVPRVGGSRQRIILYRTFQCFRLPTIDPFVLIVESEAAVQCLHSQTITICVTPDRVRNILVVSGISCRHDASSPTRGVVVVGPLLAVALPEVLGGAGDLAGGAALAGGGGSGGGGGFVDTLKNLIEGPEHAVTDLIQGMTGGSDNDDQSIGGSQI
jgi:hypothetical protein